MQVSKLFVFTFFAAAVAAASLSAEGLLLAKDCSVIPGGWTRAIANCTAVLEAPRNITDEERAYAHAGRGLAFLHNGDNDHAIQDFDEAIKIDGKLYYSYYGRGLAYFRMKDFDRAIASLTEVIQVETPFTSLALGARGAAYRRKGDFEQAIADFKKVIQLDKANEDTEIHARLGEAYLQGEDVIDAVVEFSAAIKNSPSPWIAREYHVWRGKAYLQGKELSRAMSDFDYAISIAPSADAYLGRGEAYRKSGQEARAIADFDQALRVTREPPHATIP
jgi:tetratricopeptide (TPR) repeat protein